jgi:hypothetical protein
MQVAAGAGPSRNYTKVQGRIAPWLSLSARKCQTTAPAHGLKILDSNEGSVVRQREIAIVNNGEVVELWGRRLSKWGVGTSIFFSIACSECLLVRSTELKDSILDFA